LSFTSTVLGIQAWSRKKPSVNNLKVFGCAAYSYIPKDERGKLNPKVRKCILLGYGDIQVYDAIKTCVIHNRDVAFDENSVGFEEEQQKDDFTQDTKQPGN